MLIYLLKSGACLAIFMAFYTFFLEKENMHLFKRYYLLGALLIAFCIPLITLTSYIEMTPMLMVPDAMPSVVYDIPTVTQNPETNYLPIILWSIYGAGTLLFGAKFLINLLQIIFKINHNPKQKSKSVVHVLLSDAITPHTFFKYIFLNKQKFEQHEIPQEVFWHEETHAKQKHSIDVLFIELLQVIFWFNPLIYIAKRAIKMNHEFLADQAVLNRGISTSNYQHILLAFSSNAAESPLANAINYSSTRHAIGAIKKRFTVMKTQTSKRNIWLRSALLLPLLALTLYGFSEKKVMEKPVILQIINNENGASEALMNEYKEFMNNVEATNRIDFPQYQRAVAIYDLMSEEQINSVKKYPENIITEVSKVKSKTPTITEFNSWKDVKKFAIWIDGKPIKNSALNNYKASDIKYFTSSFVHNNAQSDKFPQPYQNHLYTEKGFEEAYLKSNVKKYNNLKAEYLKTKKENIISNDELKILKAQLDRAFDNLNKEEIEKYNIIKMPVITTNDSQLKATPAEMAEYNKLAKHYNSQSPDKTVIRVKDMRRLRELHDKMTKAQRESAEPMPNFPPPPPPATKDGKKSWTLINETISPPPPPPAANASKKQKIVYEKAMEEYKIQRESYTYKHTNDKGEVIDIIVIPENDGVVPPPPPPLRREKQNTSEIKTGFKDDGGGDPLKEKVVIGYGSVNSTTTQKQGTSVINSSNEPITVVGYDSKVLETNTNENIVLLEHWYITIDNNKYYYPYNKGDLEKYYDKYGKEVTLDIVKEYKHKNEIFEKLKSGNKHYIHKTEKEKKDIDQLYSDLGGMYFRMSKTNKTKVNRPISPILPYIKLTKNTGEVYYKKKSELTEEDKNSLPPPPPPPSTTKKN